MAFADTVDSIVTAVDEIGFCMVPAVLKSAEACRLREIIDELLALEPVPKRSSYDHHTSADGHRRLLHLAAKHEAFVELLCHPLVMAFCEKYLGSDFVCSTWTSNTLLAGCDTTYWHVDHPFWTIAPPYPVDPPLTAHVIWCLDEFTEENGGTSFIAGSHRRTRLPDDMDYSFESATVTAPAGSVIFAHGACWHSAGRNSSAAPRTGIFGRYARSYIVLQEDLKLQLSSIDKPTPLVERLLGVKQYTPQRGFPY
jgi:ectoine hydroxylase-related dioxygenase (phytanoyl-CoA dioxygenase family)